MVKFSFAREKIRAKYAPLLDAPIQEDDPRFDDYMTVMGTGFCVEAFASEEARDARLGPASEHTEYVAVSAEEIAALKYDLCQMHIGPALNEVGFKEVASAVLAAAIDDRGDDMIELTLDVVIARTEYVVRSVGPPSWSGVGWVNVFDPSISRDEQTLERDTSLWLRGFFAGHLAAVAR